MTDLVWSIDRLGADSGAIGGNLSQEFQVIADTGEDVIVYCPESDFAANIELAPALSVIEKRAEPTEEMKMVATPGKEKVRNHDRVSWPSFDKERQGHRFGY